MDSNGVETNAVDVKYFLNTGEFTYQWDATGYSWFTAGTGFETYHTFGSMPWDDHIGTGTALDGGTKTGWQYDYINAYSTSGSEASGQNQWIATIYLMPAYGASDGDIDFYYLGSQVSQDDTNVASGTNNDTQYIDALTGVAGDGNYSVIDSYACIYRPYIARSAYYESDLGTSITTSPYASGGAEDTSLETLAPSDTVINPTAPQYTTTITHTWGADYNTGAYTTDDSWEIWTNQPILLTITGNDDNNILIDETTINDTNISALQTTPDVRGNTKIFVISGNVYKDEIEFHNFIGNTGTTIGDYTTKFMINVFWFDDFVTNVKADYVGTGDGYALVSFSGHASTSSDPDSHADWTTDDDQFRIIGFSGKNTLNYSYSNDELGYNETLNNLYVRTTDQYFGMILSGQLPTTIDPQNVVASTGTLIFTETWSGRVYYSDIAGNVSGTWVDVIVEPSVDFIVNVNPAFRNEIGDLSTTGHFRLAWNNGWTWTYTHNSENGNTQLAINEKGTGLISVVVPGTGVEYLVIFKGTGMLSIGFTGIWSYNLNDNASHVFDLSGGVNVGITSTLYPPITYGSTTYEIGGDVVWTGGIGHYDYINAGDLTRINTNLTIGVFDTNDLYMDFNVNSVISAIEQAIALNYRDQNGWIDQYGDGINYPAKSTFKTF